MKASLMKIAIIASFAVILSACSSDGEVRDTGVTAVKSFYEPNSGKTIVLQSSASATMYFEWEPARAEDSGNVLYEIVFDKADGNFANPIMVLAADNNGGSNHATITHKQLNSIAAKAGVESSAQGTLKWTVYSSKGPNAMKAEEERAITVTRLAGFADIPAKVYLTGEGTEGGADLSKALQMKSTADGEFEIYSNLVAGKTYQFVDGVSATHKVYSISAGMLTEDGTGTVSKTGVYKFNIDFNTKMTSIEEVTKVVFFMCTPEQKVELTYQGNGVWLGANTVPDFTTNWSDDRYAFLMTVKTSGNDVVRRLGSTKWDNSNPNSSTADSYYYLKIYDESNVSDRWGYSFKFPDKNAKSVDISVLMSGNISAYTHKMVIKN